MMTEIILIEDDPLWAAFAVDAFKSNKDFRMIGVAGTAREGVARCSEFNPHIAVVDLRLPDGDGLALIDQLAKECPKVRLLLFTARADDAVIAKIFQAPVWGMLWKAPGPGAELVHAAKSIAEGSQHYSLEALHAWRRFHAAPNSFLKILSSTEIRLVPLFAEGRSDEEVAELVGGKPSTAHSHRKNIMAKLGLHSQPELQRWGSEHGLYEPSRPAPPCGVFGRDWSQANIFP